MLPSNISIPDLLKDIEKEVSIIQDTIASIGRLNILKHDENSASEEYSGIQSIEAAGSAYSQLLFHYHFSLIERIALSTALAWEYTPEIFDPFLLLNPYTNSPYTEYGGHISGSNQTFSPTFETVFYILAGNSLQKRLKSKQAFQPTSKLFTSGLLTYSEVQHQISWKQSVIRPSEEFLAVLQGETFKPNFSTSFPAELITTKINAEEVILDYDTENKVNEIHTWLKHGQTVLNHAQFGRKVKPGYKAMFYGPSGTGKTLTAMMLGKLNNLDVYRIDLSMLVSKWVGETEKNLKNVFDLAENKNWILFFDEADSVFGKRSVTQSSNDRYANQEVSYLLQRMEEYPGLIILATNLKANIDPAFHRRINNIIYFPAPSEDMRRTLWEKMIPEDFTLDQVITMEELSKIDLSGGEMLNIVHYCMLKSYERGEQKIIEEDMTYAIRKELQKKGKIHS